MKTFGLKLFMLSLIIACVCCKLSTSQSVSFANEMRHTEDSIKLPVSALDTIIGDSIFSFVEEMPEFPGGDGAMIRFLMNNLRMNDTSDANCYRRVIIQFIVDKNGRTINPQMLRSSCPEMDKQYIKIIKSFPVWKPGKHNGKPVNVYFVMPIVI